jgi:hypothetical protein
MYRGIVCIEKLVPLIVFGPSLFLTGTTTSEEDIFQANIALLFTPQEGASHAILGLCLAPAGICGVSKTQHLAKRKAEKNAKSELDEDKKFAVAACKAESVSKKKELLA